MSAPAAWRAPQFARLRQRRDPGYRVSLGRIIPGRIAFPRLVLGCCLLLSAADRLRAEPAQPPAAPQAGVPAAELPPAPALQQKPIAGADAASAYARAQQLAGERRFREAAALFAEASGQADAPPDTLLREAKALLSAGDPAAAEPVLQRYLARAPQSAEALYLLGYVLQRRNHPSESLAVYTRAAAIEPPHAEDLRLVALNYVLLDSYPDAIHWLNRALALDPRSAEAWYDLGRAQMHQGNFVEAERCFQHTLALSPGQSKALDNLGLSLEAQNRTAEALAAYEQAIAAQSVKGRVQSEQPLLNLGTLLNTLSRGAEAVAPLRDAIALAPGSARCHEELARSYLQTRDEAAARHEFEQAIVLDPKNPRLHFQLGQLFRRAGDSARADAELKASAALYGTHSSTPEPK